MATTSRSRLSFSYEGFGAFLRSESAEKDMKAIADEAKDFAESTSPVGDRRHDPHSGRYKASFSVETRRDGGYRGNRAEASLVNTSPEAHIVEWGNRNMTGRHTMMGAMKRATG